MQLNFRLFGMKQTTLCYLEQGNQYLMLHRVKKKEDASHDKWIGVGGKCEGDESPDECMIREVKEETGLDVLRWCYRGSRRFRHAETEHVCLQRSRSQEAHFQYHSC